MVALYNEIDDYAADWLENLIVAKLIAPGVVDRRSIVDLQPADLTGFTQVHFFAGIGGWSLAARLAGWPDDRPLWTGSCPCQPFSVANLHGGGAKGQADERHLLPDFVRLIAQCRPPVIFGEQVRNAIKWGWLDEAFGSLESIEYACAAIVAPALAFGARHERERIYWVADAGCSGQQRHRADEPVSFTTRSQIAEHGNPLAEAGRILDSGIGCLLPRDGLSADMESLALHGFGNAIVPQVAAEIIGAYMDCAPPEDSLVLSSN